MIKLKNLESDFQFKKLLTQKKIITDYFSIYFGKNLSRENNNKLNISFVMKKKIGSSVIRNKIKRRLRSAIQKRLKDKKFIDINYSYIIFGKSKTFTEKYSIISDALDKTFSKINQISNQNEVH
ncbi:MAG: ribonuclease P protein component [Pelagibacteraceae bacterium]|jgi:ribonuclease P protein component|nr:ribonuclease P protein component [Pelagibacteraceae bacterium]|tara:strand:+ start:664 stop:1035 length:372 start_codon:yes stop_codon:yes gene_type:complete